MHGDFKFTAVLRDYVIDFELSTWEGRSVEDRRAVLSEEEVLLRIFGYSDDDGGGGGRSPTTLMFDCATSEVVPILDAGATILAQQVRDMRYIENWDLGLYIAWLYEKAVTAGGLPPADFTLVENMFRAVFVDTRIAHAFARCPGLPWPYLRRFFQSQGRGAQEAVSYLVYPDAIDRVLHVVGVS